MIQKLYNIMFDGLEIVVTCFLTMIAILLLEESWRKKLTLPIASLLLGIVGGIVGLSIGQFVGILSGVICTVIGPYIVMYVLTPSTRMKIVQDIVDKMKDRVK
jgi:membrane associated rhomboid family serine protease